MATCPRGHESTTLDYCDQCGTPMAARNGSAGAGPSPTAGAATGAGSGSGGGPTTGHTAGSTDAATVAGRPCPVCGSIQTGRFCEEDGYDFLLAPPVPTSAPATGAGIPGPGAPSDAGIPGPGAPSVGAGSIGVGGQPAPVSGSSLPARTARPAGPGLLAVVSADRAWYDVVVGMGGEDSGGLTFPRFVAERRFPLRTGQLLIGRISRSRGVYPDIDLSGPPEDPGVSHTHALLMSQPGGWVVVDLQSANGTYVNDPESAPIPSETPVPVRAGDRIFVGAWTCLTIREADSQT